MDENFSWKSEIPHVANKKSFQIWRNNRKFTFLFIYKNFTHIKYIFL